jgi:stage II sporulation protein R
MKVGISIFIAVICFLILTSIIPTKEEADIYNSTIRLHVIANSDSERDQALKLLVRDAILKRMKDYTATTKEQAIDLITSDKENLQKIATQCLKKEGVSAPVLIELTEESYPTKDYEGFTLPAGVYTSLKVIIGNGEGQNWWCVLYPPLCTSVAIDYDDNASIQTGLSKDQYNLITGANGEYKVKLKLLEIASRAFGFDY